MIHPLDATEQTALLAMQEAHDQKMWSKVLAVGDAWIADRGGLPAVAATMYAEGLMVEGRIEDAIIWAGKAANGLRNSTSAAQVAAWMALGRAFSRAGDFTDSAKAITKAIRVKVDEPEVIEKQGHALMSISKKWRKGWAMHESRLQADNRQLPPNMRRWDGKTQEPVSILHEQGIGDAILATRWLPEIAKKSGHPVTWLGPKLLHRWIGGLPNVLVGDIDSAVAKADGGAALYAMSLPHVLRCDSPDDVAPEIAPPALVSLHRNRSFAKPLTVGICWKGSAAGWHDFERSYTYEQFAPIWKSHPKVRFVNLCHDVDVPADAPFAKATFVDAYHTGECIAACDLVITVDTAVAHMAGSMGVATICLVPTVADWRWDWPVGKGTPWYKTVSVVRRPNAYSLAAINTATALLGQLSASLHKAVA